MKVLLASMFLMAAPFTNAALANDCVSDPMCGPAKPIVEIEGSLLCRTINCVAL